jgi:hypothetical protein
VLKRRKGHIDQGLGLGPARIGRFVIWRANRLVERIVVHEGHRVSGSAVE